ncbi:hypothetical protein K3495_g7625 [Podosphaera aphanis]|nr:hypothetical protein K3495_g7625 [Podosphaera aphanis]
MSALFWAARGRLVRLRIFTFRLQFRSFTNFNSESSPSVRELLRAGEKESIDVNCCSSGSIRVDIFNHHVLRDPSAPLVFYLPTTGSHLSKYHPPIPSYLFSTSAALVQVNYRWNIPVAKTHLRKIGSTSDMLHPFPIPIHDVFQAWHYILDTYLPSLLPKQPSTLPLSESEEANNLSPITNDISIQRPIIIYGEFLGATLAASLALTQSSSSPENPARILGLIAKQGIYDWLNIEADEVSPINNEDRNMGSDKTVKHSTKLTVQKLRKRLFLGPSGCFDAFASPILLFRTPGILVPKEWATIDFCNSDSPLASQEKKEFITPEDMLRPVRENYNFSKRDLMSWRSSLVFPPLDSDLKIPKTLFLCRDHALEALDSKRRKYPGCNLSGIDMVKQSENLARFMRRSLEDQWRRRIADAVNNADRQTYDNTLSPMEIVQFVNLENDFEGEQNFVQGWIESCL